MRSAFVIIFVLFTLILVSACSALEFGGDKELDKLADSYGGVYVFDRKLREEIIQREAEREEARKKVTLGNTFWDQMDEIDKKFPQTLSNGCRYFVDKGFNFDYKQEYAYYENKIKEFTGDEAYKKIRPYLGITSYYECKGKKYPLTMHPMITYVKTSYGLYGDEGAGFRLSKGRLKGAGKTAHFYYLIDGKFVKGEETKGDFQ